MAVVEDQAAVLGGPALYPLPSFLSPQRLSPFFSPIKLVECEDGGDGGCPIQRPRIPPCFLISFSASPHSATAWTQDWH
uniref:Uncharacterized protein n=1 Tax=Oryza barthii TaxID=65489 RepID=A0A0D3H4S3_9ORYZ